MRKAHVDSRLRWGNTLEFPGAGEACGTNLPLGDCTVTTNVATVRSGIQLRCIGSPSPQRRAFTIAELMVTLAITALLSGLLMPTLTSVRENARRVVCASNQRQLGQAITMYAGDTRNRLPVAGVLDQFEPLSADLMVARHGAHQLESPSTGPRAGRQGPPEPLPDGTWDGLGRLFQWHYCDTADCFYCPSHRGDNRLEEQRSNWNVKAVQDDLYTNYHYAGHKDWRTGKRRSLLKGHKLVLAMDGLRTRDDFSHGSGMNVLRGDGSVSWRDNVLIQGQLPLYVPEGTVIRDQDDLIYDLFLDS